MLFRKVLMQATAAAAVVYVPASALDIVFTDIGGVTRSPAARGFEVAA